MRRLYLYIYILALLASITSGEYCQCLNEDNLVTSTTIKCCNSLKGQIILHTVCNIKITSNGFRRCCIATGAVNGKCSVVFNKYIKSYFILG